MFGSKSLLSCKRAGTLCLFYASKAKKTKEIGVLGVVNYNKENKYLFGNLLETRAQRRKTLKKVNKSIFRIFKKHASNIKSKLLNALLRETRVLTLSRINCKLNYPNSCLISSNESQRHNALSSLLANSEKLPNSTSLQFGSISRNGSTKCIERRCTSHDMNRTEWCSECSTRKVIPECTHCSDIFSESNESLNVIYSHVNNSRRIPEAYRNKMKHRILDNALFKPYTLAKRFIHRKTKKKDYSIQPSKNDINLNRDLNKINSFEVFHKDLNEFPIKISRILTPSNPTLFKVDEGSFVRPNEQSVVHSQSKTFQSKNVHEINEMNDLHMKINYSFHKCSKTDLGDEKYSFFNSIEDYSESMRKSPITYSSSDQDRAGTKVTSFTRNNHMIDRVYNHDEITSNCLTQINNYFANKRQSPVPEWGDRLSFNKKSIYSIVNSKGIHTNSNDKFKHYNNIDELSKKSKKTNGILERHDRISAGDYFSIKSLTIKYQKKNAGLDNLSSNSPADGEKKGNRTPASKSTPELVRKGSSCNKLEKSVKSSKNGSLNNLKKFTTEENSRISRSGLIYKETGKDRSKSSRNNYSQIPNFLQETGSKNIKESYSISTCNFERYFQNRRDLEIPKSSADGSHFSKMSPSKNDNESGKDSDCLQINKNEINFSFWPDRSKTNKFSNVEETSLQGRYSDAGGISSLLFPRKSESISSSSYSCRKNNQKYKFKVHNNMLKASNDSSFKVPYNAVREKDTMKPNHILPETVIFGAGNDMNDELKGIKTTNELNNISGDCNIENGFKSDLFCTDNVEQDRNMNKYFPVVDCGNPESGSDLNHREINQDRERIQISDLLFQRNSCRNVSSLKPSVKKGMLDNNSSLEINQEKITILEEKSKLGAGSEKILVKNLIKLFNSLHSHDNDKHHSKNFKIAVTKKESSSIHCNELNSNKKEKEKGKQLPLSKDSNERSSRKILKFISDNLDCNPATNNEIDQMSMPLFVKNLSKDKESLNEANYRGFDTVTKNNSDKHFFKTKDNKQNSHSGLNFSKSIRNEELPCRFEHVLHDSNSSNVSITENYEKKLVNCNSHETNKNNTPGDPQNSQAIGNLTGWNSSQHMFSCDHTKKMKIKYEKNENNFHHLSSKSNRQLIDLFENYVNKRYPDSLNDVPIKQNQGIMKEKSLVSSSNTPSNHNNIKFGSIKDHHNNSTNQKIAVRNVDSKLTNLQSPSIKNVNVISQSLKKLNFKEALKTQNKVSEKHSDKTESSKLYTTPYFFTLNPQRSDVGNDSLNFQIFNEENINSVRPYSRFDRSPYYHSVEECNLSLGGVSKHSYCSNSTSESSKFISENHLLIDSNSIFKDSFGFCHRQFDDKTQLDTSAIPTSDSKFSFEKEEHIEHSLNDNLSAKTPEKTEKESNSKNGNVGHKLDTLMREKDIITHNLKAIVDFCFSLNIPPKTEMTHRDVPLILHDDDEVKSNDKVRKIKDEIVLNRMKTIIEAFPSRKTIDDIYHSNKENSNLVVNQRQCPKYQHEGNENNPFKKVIPGCDSKNIANVSDAYNIRSNTLYHLDSFKNNFPLTHNRDSDIDRISEKSLHMKIIKCKMTNIDHIKLERDCNEFRHLNTQQNHFQRSEPKVKDPSIDVTSNSDYVPHNSSSNINKNEVFFNGTKGRDNYSCRGLVSINENRNHCPSLSNTKKCDQAQDVLKYEDSHTFKSNPAIHNNYEENGFVNNTKIADDTRIDLNNECMKEDYDFLNSTSPWNLCDRQKYFKLTSTLRNAIFQRNKIDEQNNLGNSKSLNDRKSMTDRDKFKYFSNFLKEAVIERENIYKQLQIAPFKNKSLTSESDPILCLGSPSSQVQDSKVENSNCKQIEFSNNYSFKELEEQTSKLCYSVDDEDYNNECNVNIKCLNSCNESYSLNNESKIMKLGEDFDIHIPNRQLIRRNSSQSSTIGSVYNIAPPVVLKRPITNNCDNNLSILSNHIPTASDRMQLEKVVDVSTLRGRSQSDLNLNSSGANTYNELDKFKSLLRHSSSSDTKMKFFNSLKLSACRQMSNYSVKSETISNHTQLSNNSGIFSNNPGCNERLMNNGHFFKSSVYPQNIEDISFMSSAKVMTCEKIVFPEILEDCCVLQEQDAAVGEGHLKGGDSLGEITTKTSLKTSRKQKSKSKPSKTSVNNKSYSTVTGTNDVEKLLGNQSSLNSCINLTDKKLDCDEGNTSRTINFSYNEIGKSNPNIEGNVLDHVKDELHVNSLFPLINLRKSHLEYEACVEPVINISYESLCKNVLSGLPSVGKILSETMPASARAALERWKKNMIAQLGEEGFQKLNKENLARGSLFHEYVRRYLVGETSNAELPEKVQYYFKSLAAVFPHISDVKVVESHVAHSQLHYCGFIDCVAKYDGTPVVIEWKLAEKRKPDIRSTYDAPLQMSAYLGALNYDDNYNFPVASGVVVAAYTDGSPANVFHLPEETCVNYWESFQIRLQEFKKLKSVKLK